MKMRVFLGLGLMCAFATATAGFGSSVTPALPGNVIAIDLDSPGVPGQSDRQDLLGDSVATGDFNGDGVDDLAIGIPAYGRPIGFDDTGAVLVLYGRVGQLPLPGPLLQQTAVALEDGPEFEDFFGSTLAVGDFNNDEYDDLVVGVGAEDVVVDEGNQIVDYPNAGALNIFYGQESGLTQASDYLTIDSGFSRGPVIQAGAGFGSSLAVGDFNGDGTDDLAVGAPGYDIDVNGTPSNAAGLVAVYSGAPGSISGSERFLLSQGLDSVFGDAEDFDFFGNALASGDFDGDGYDDLAIGVPNEDFRGFLDTGVVQVFMGSDGGPELIAQTWSQEILTGVVLEDSDLFGSALATGDFNGDGFDELMVGARGESVGTEASAGAASVIQGSEAGLTTQGNRTFTQNSPELSGVAESGDRLGFALAVADLNEDGFDEALMSAPEEGSANLGIVHWIYGSTDGLSGSPGGEVIFEDGARELGASLAAGNLGLGETIVAGAPISASDDGDGAAGRIYGFTFLNPFVIFKNGFEDVIQG